VEHCDQCLKFKQVTIKPDGEIFCPICIKSWGKVEDQEAFFKACAVCGCRQFYLAKDFNRFFGCAVILTAIILVPFTYGLSLPVFALVDWLLYKRSKTTVNCYKCGTEYHGFNIKKNLKPFMHHIGLKYDKYR
jgi:hypothetical protein